MVGVPFGLAVSQGLWNFGRNIDRGPEGDLRWEVVGIWDLTHTTIPIPDT